MNDELKRMLHDYIAECYAGMFCEHFPLEIIDTCQEANTHQLWKGNLETYLGILDDVGLGLLITGVICTLLLG